MLLLPVATIVIIAVVSAVILVVIIAAVLRTTLPCCRRKKNQGGAKHEELDRFLQPEESEDEYLIPSSNGSVSKGVVDTFKEAYEEDEFHYVQDDGPVEAKPVAVDPSIASEGSIDTELGDDITNPAETTAVSCTVALPEESPTITNSEITTPIEDISISVNDILATPVTDPPSSEVPTIELSTEEPISPELQAIDSPELLVEASSGSRDDLSVHSDEPSHITDTSVSKGKKLSLQSRLSRSTQRICSSFSESATLKVSLQYIESVKCLKGCIISISGLDFQAEHCPHEINFHLRFFPNKKFHMATKNKAVWEDTDLNLTFTMGPVFINDLTDNKLRIKLYGKKTQRLTRSKCYGECSLHLEDVVGKTEETEFEEILVQRMAGSSRSSSDSDGIM